MHRLLRPASGRARPHLDLVRAATAASLAGLLALGTGCQGQVAPAGTAGSTGGSSSPAGAGGAVGMGSTGGSVGAGTGGGVAGGGGGAGGPGSGGASADPYAVPSAPPASVLVAAPRVVRLSRRQWSNAVRDLLLLPDISEVEGDVSADALLGFDDEASALYVTEQLRAQLFDASEKLADKVTADAAALARLMPANAPADAAGKAKAFITGFGLRAFRRPLTDAEVTTLVGVFGDGPTLYPGVDAFKAGVSLVIQAVLQSPFFLYRTEFGTPTAGATKVPLDDWEVAAKLALAITNTIPDSTLLAEAAAGRLRDKAGVMAQARRLLEGATGTAGIGNFNFQLYRLGSYEGILRDPTVFPDFKPATPAAMKQEALQFLNWVFTQGRGIRDVYTAPAGFVNGLLAPLYGVSGTFSADPLVLTKVDLDPSQRAGLLTRAGFLSSHIMSDHEPDIIRRGVFVATRLLCKVLPPPDPNAVGAMFSTSPTLTNRERVDMVTGPGTCGQVCHGALFNPLGYAFENYDALGKYRTTDRGKTVNAADAYVLDGKLQTFSNALELSRLLGDAKESHACYLQNLMTYLHGRQLDTAEGPTVDYYARLSRAGMASLRDLEFAIVASEAFLNRSP